MAKVDKRMKNLKDVVNKVDKAYFSSDFSTHNAKLVEFIHIFDDVTDTRIKAKCKYSTKFIVVIVFLAVLEGCISWDEIADFAYDRKKLLEDYIEYPDTLPVHDTYMRVFSKINSDTLETNIVKFLEKTSRELASIIADENDKEKKYEQIAIDGKALRGSGRKYDTDEKVPNMQIMHFWDVSNIFCVKSVAISEKTNEIPVAQAVLKTLDIKGKIVTSDAMNCQKETARVIEEGKGHYVLALKANHSEFFNDIEAFFKDAKNLEKIKKNSKNYTKPDPEKNHNQVEIREYFRINAKNFYQEEDWSNIRSIVYYKKTTWKVLTGKEYYEHRYFISDLTDIELIADAQRNHWSVENDLHHALDTLMMEDANKTMNKNANFNLSQVRKMSVSLWNFAKPLFGNVSKQRARKSFNRNYEGNLIKLFNFLDGEDLKEALQIQKNNNK